METVLLRSFAAGGRLLGTRSSAVSIRTSVEAKLNRAIDLAIDFEGTQPTQSFVDELIGMLLLKHGEVVLEHLALKNCSTETKKIIHFVISDRLDQIQAQKSEVGCY